MKKLLLFSFFYCSLFYFAQFHSSITSPTWSIVKINNIDVPNGTESTITLFSTMLQCQYLHHFEGSISFSQWERKFVKTGEMEVTIWVDIPGLADEVYQISSPIISILY